MAKTFNELLQEYDNAVDNLIEYQYQVQNGCGSVTAEAALEAKRDETREALISFVNQPKTGPHTKRLLPTTLQITVTRR